MLIQGQRGKKLQPLPLIKKESSRIAENLFCTSRSSKSVQEILDEITALKGVYPESIQIVNKPSESSKGELKVLLENTQFQDRNIEIKLEFLIKFEFSYPSTSPHLVLVSHQGIDYKPKAQLIITKASQLAENLSSVGERSLYDIVTIVSSEIEQLEETLMDNILRKEEYSRQQAINESKKQAIIARNKHQAEEVTKINMEFQRKIEDRQRAMQGKCVANEENVAETLKKHKIENFLDKGVLYNPVTGNSDKEIKVKPKESKSHAGPSRFAYDFTMIKTLGKGAFGRVFKVKNNLDENKYAIKRMVLNYNHKKKVEKILTEVQLLSQIHHMNIVRYYQAWTESIPLEELQKLKNELSEDSGVESEDEAEEEEEDNENGVKATESGDAIKFHSKISSIEHRKDESSGAWNQAYDLANDDSQDKTVGHGQDHSSGTSSALSTQKVNASSRSNSSSSSSSSSSRSSSRSSGGTSVISGKNKKLSSKSDSEKEESKSEWDPSADEEEEAPAVPTIKMEEMELFDHEGNFHTKTNLHSVDKKSIQYLKKSLRKNETWTQMKDESKNAKNMKYLYIQMECCELQTLRDFIDKGHLKRDDSLFNKLITQMLDAFNYIHELKIIHRDVKPSNIFLDQKNNIKLGDFGLATQGGGVIANKSTPQENNQSIIQANSDMSFNVGTPIYMSPEQEAGGKYDCMADMWSLGIIMFEMVYGPFKAEMERLRLITDLRKNQALPKDYDERTGKIGAEVSKFDPRSSL